MYTSIYCKAHKIEQFIYFLCFSLWFSQYDMQAWFPKLLSVKKITVIMLILVVLTALFRLVESSTENSTVVWTTRNSIDSSTGNSIVLTTENSTVVWTIRNSIVSSTGNSTIPTTENSTVVSTTRNSIVSSTGNSTVVWTTRNSIVSSTGNSIVPTTGNKLITWVVECCPNNIATSWSQQALNNLLTACNNMMIFTRVIGEWGGVWMDTSC